MENKTRHLKCTMGANAGEIWTYLEGEIDEFARMETRANIIYIVVGSKSHINPSYLRLRFCLTPMEKSAWDIYCWIFNSLKDASTMHV